MWHREKGNLMIITCPRCSSTFEIPAQALSVKLFICPVCSEGEIRILRETTKENGNDSSLKKQSNLLSNSVVYSYSNLISLQ